MNEINTIFYFPASLTFEEYTTKLNQGEIAARTIVFADAQKAIYKGGKKYGGWTKQEFYHEMEEYESYDDSWINDEIAAIKADILGAEGRIDGLDVIIGQINARLEGDLADVDESIKDKVEALF